MKAPWYMKITKANLPITYTFRNGERQDLTWFNVSLSKWWIRWKLLKTILLTDISLRFVNRRPQIVFTINVGKAF